MRLSPRQLAANAAPPAQGADEVLVIDPRGTLTPAQMVERKLLALLQTGNPGLYAQAADGRHDLRRNRVGPDGTHPFVLGA
jgi:hypothetical protein